MRTVNRVVLLGAVGKDPDVRATSGGTCVANFSLATSYQNKDKQQVTEWHRLVAFKRTAEIVRDYVVKGSKLYIEGQLQTRKWEKDGEAHYTTEIIIRDLSLLENKAASASRAAQLHGGTNDQANPDISDDDIPF